MMKKVFSIFLLILCVIFVCSTVGNAAVTEKASEVTFDAEYHRGGRNSRPENTLYSYLFAIENGATTIECDMQLTNDGQIVLSHDPFLDPVLVRDEKGNYVSRRLDLRTMTLPQIRKFDVAQIKQGTEYYTDHGATQIVPDHAQIPTIDELFALVKKYGRGVQINIETKIYHDLKGEPRAIIEADAIKFVKLFYKKVLEYGLEDQVILQSFDWKSLVEMKKIAPKIRVSALWSEQPKWGRTDEYLRPYEPEASPYLAGLHIDDFEGDAVKAAHSLGFDIVSPYCREVTIDMVDEAHEFGMKIIPWNANTRNEIEAMYAMGVDGIITDNGPLLREFLLEKGETLFAEKCIKESKYHLDEKISNKK